LEEAEKRATHPGSQTIIKRLKAEWLANAGSLERNAIPRISQGEAELAVSEFGATLWEEGAIFDDFQRPRNWRWGACERAVAGTDIRMLNDGRYLYVRCTADPGDLGEMTLMPAAPRDTWPIADRVELYLENKSGQYLFAFDGNGNQYDAKYFDRRWNAGWQLRCRKTANRWEAIAVIPLDALQYHPEDEDAALSIFIIRNAVAGQRVEECSFRGGILRQRAKYPLIIK